MTQIHSKHAPDAATLDTLPYRHAIDRVATLRAQVGAVALNVCLLEEHAETGANEELCAAISEKAKSIRAASDVLLGKAVFDGLPEPLSHWMSMLSAQMPVECQRIAKMADHTDRLARMATAREAISASDLKEYTDQGQGPFFDAVSKIIDAFWNSIEKGRTAQLSTAAQSAKNVSASLDRLDRIGKYVRSMSINASVEASRAGESGKGMTIIATEFKTLAEEVQQLIAAARKDIDVFDREPSGKDG